MSSYTKGRNYEYKVKKKLEKEGFFVVRCASSKPIDLIAIKNKKIRLIECKKTGYVRPEHRKKIKEIEKVTRMKVEVI